jgi:hypothetical protein
MSDKFNIELADRLQAEDASVAKQLEERGWTKAEDGFSIPSDCTEIEDLALAANVYAYREIRDLWTSLLRNDGLTDAEYDRYTFFSNGKKKVRSPQEAMQDMKATFQEILDEVTVKIEQKFGNEVPIRDVMSRIQFPQIMQRVMELPMMQPLEPAYVLQPLFRRMSIPDMFGGPTVKFHFPILGALTASELGEDAEEQEKDLDIAGGAMLATFGKIGVKFMYSEDFDKFKNFDWFGIVLQACRQALLREKERRAAVHIRTRGLPVINNTGRHGFSGTPQAGTVGSAGTGINGLRNGTHVLQDLFYMMTSFNDDGLFPDTVVLSPRAWLIWAQSPEMRAFAFQNGIPQMWQMPSGQFGKARQHEVFGGILGPSPDHPRGSSAYTPHPQEHLPLPLRVVVSPFVESGVDNNIEYTDAHMLDVATGIGYLMQAEEVRMNSWTEPEHDLTKVKFRERYAYGTVQDSTTIRHMKRLKTRELGIDARDRIMFGINWSGAGGGPQIGNE